MNIRLKESYRFPHSLTYRYHPVLTVAVHCAAYGWYMDSRPSHRTENRTLLEVGVTLASLDLVTYEVTTTRDVSLHGASVLTKQQWPPNQRLDVRSLQGSFKGFARVVHCYQRGGPAFVMGLEFFFTNGNWNQDREAMGRAATG